MNKYISKSIPVALAFTLALSTVISGCSKNKITITGEIESQTVDISSKIAGRIKELNFKEGDIVKQNDVLGFLESKEIEAKMKSISAAKKESQEQLKLAESTFTRIAELLKNGNISKQQYEETKYKLEAAKQKLEATNGQENELIANHNEQFIKATIDGEISQTYYKQGELISPLSPILSIVDTNQSWLVLNIKEDLLMKFTKDSILEIFIPALKKKFNFKVYFISAMGSFAKFKATNEQNSYDLKIFEVRARPIGKIENIRPGMTAILEIEK